MASVAALLGMAALAVLLTAGSGGGDPTRYRIVLDNAFGLVEGGDFRVGGVRAGRTTGFTIEKRRGHGARAVVTAEVTEPGFDDLREDASCGVKPQSLIGEYYVDCQPGGSRRRLPTDGSGTVPVEHTFSTIPTDLVNNILRRPYRERFRLILTELGTGLAGRTDDLQAVLRRAHPGLRETSRVLRILGDQNRVIEDFVRDSDTVVGELADNRRDVARWVGEAGDAAEISASRRDALRQNFRRLPVLLGELRPTMARLGDLAGEQRPLLGDLRRAAPSLNALFTRLGPFSEASRPALRSLGEASASGRSALDEGRQEIAELRTLADDAPPFAKPLRQFLQTVDDRNRAVETDPRAKPTAPPAPDPTAMSQEGGFTGLEAVWDYFFWQTLALNSVDESGHILRLGVTANECSNFQNEPPTPGDPADAKLFQDCNQWMGPYQAGVTRPDFTGNRSQLGALERQARRPAVRRGERRAPGQPEAGPLPGQPDLSKPQLALPPALQELLDSLAPGGLPKTGVPPVDGADPSRLLDFLLAP